MDLLLIHVEHLLQPCMGGDGDGQHYEVQAPCKHLEGGRECVKCQLVNKCKVWLKSYWKKSQEYYKNREGTEPRVCC